MKWAISRDALYSGVFSRRDHWVNLQQLNPEITDLLDAAGVDVFPVCVASFEREPSRHYGWMMPGLRTLFVNTEFDSTSDMFRATVVHEYIHSWLEYLKFGRSNQQNDIVVLWWTIMRKWASGEIELELDVDLDDVKNSVPKYRDDRTMLRQQQDAKVARNLHSYYTELFARMLDSKCSFEPVFGRLCLTFEDITFDVETNPTLEQPEAAAAAICMFYGQILLDLDIAIKTRYTVEESHYVEEAICYFLSASITGTPIETFSDITDQANIEIANRIRLKSSEVVHRLRASDDVWAAMAKICNPLEP